MANKTVSHCGFVDSVDGSAVRVRIMALSACAGCHGEQHCCSNEKMEKVIDAIAAETLNAGDAVIVEMAQKLGNIAVLWMFIYPTLLLFVTLFSLSYAFHNDLLAASAALISVGLYYGIIFLFRTRISKDFVFTAKLNRNYQG